MQVALGWKAHSGWAALVALGLQDGIYTLALRRRVELVEEAWEKMPYHAAGSLTRNADDADRLVHAGIEVAQRMSAAAMQSEIRQLQQAGHEVMACGVVVGKAMPAWSTAEILAAHLRMHQAEGCLFREVLLQAARGCGLPTLAIVEKTLMEQASATLRLTPAALQSGLAVLGKLAGPPWGQDQKEAALAAMLALHHAS
jgi:hypothetical protein